MMLWYDHCSDDLWNEEDFNDFVHSHFFICWVVRNLNFLGIDAVTLKSAYKSLPRLTN